LLQITPIRFSEIKLYSKKIHFNFVLATADSSTVQSKSHETSTRNPGKYKMFEYFTLTK